MSNHLQLASFRNLQKAGRNAVRLSVNIYQLGCSSYSLGRISSHLLRRPLQLGHLVGTEELAGIGPAFDPSCRSDFHEAPLIIDNVKPLAVPDCGCSGRLGIQVLVQQQSSRTHVSLTHGRGSGLLRATGDEKN